MYDEQRPLIPPLLARIRVEIKYPVVITEQKDKQTDNVHGQVNNRARIQLSRPLPSQKYTPICQQPTQKAVHAM